MRNEEMTMDIADTIAGSPPTKDIDCHTGSPRRLLIECIAKQLSGYARYSAP
jgi:hypothetical protein